MDRHPFRPAHIHLIVRSPSTLSGLILTETLQVQREGYKPVTTQIFDRKDKYLDNDSVFAVKDSLIVDFKPLKGNPKATLELEYDIILAPQGE
jgi:catechol 1,2-dioxygenase